MSKFLKLSFIRVLLGVTFLFVLFPVLSFLNAFNPMQQAFVNNFYLTNNTDRNVFITPVGTSNGGNRKIVMRQFTGEKPAFLTSEDRNILVKPKTTKHIFFEDDNFCLSQIIVENDRGDRRQLNVGREIMGCNQVTPISARFEIKDFSNLTALDQSIENLPKIQSNRIWLYWLSSLILFFFLMRWHRFVYFN